MEFLETSVFTKQIMSIFGDHEYAQLQAYLARYPDAGTVIPKAGGLRKIRWKTKEKGKRAGIRIIYYWYFSRSQIFMLLAYRKSESTDMSPKQLKELMNIIKENVL